MDAARHWARGGKTAKDGVAGDLRAFGAPEELIGKWDRGAADDAFEVMAENREAVELFLACQSQWRFAGMDGAPVGIDYAGLEAAMRMMGTKRRAERFAELRLMEAAALDELGKRRASRRKAGHG